MITRRRFIAATAGASFSIAGTTGTSHSRPVLILAPTNLGLRPNEDGTEPGTWRSPDVLMRAGLARRLSPAATVRLPRPTYRREAEPGTRLRNGNAIRRFSIDLAAHVSAALATNSVPVVIGGDCSILLGCLLGARRSGRAGLIHLDGHSDFFHPGNYDTHASLGSVAGMDLALATGRGERLLTDWPGVVGPLVVDRDAAQIGERDALSPDFDRYYGDIRATAITRVIIQQVRREGIDATVARMAAWLEGQSLARVWLHVDLDVLDAAVMPAVDSPGSPGLDYDSLVRLIGGLRRTGRVIGAGIAIYDPDRDPGLRHAARIVDCIARAFT